MGDFIIVPRELFRDEALDEGRFSRREALLDLIQQANYTEGKEVRIKGGVATLQRGQLVASVRFLALRWGWSTGKVAKVLDDFVREQRLTHINSTITILNYDEYQGIVNADQDAKQDKSNKVDKEKNKEKKEIKEKEEAVVNHLYSLYPATTYRGERGVVKTGKCPKDKVRLAYLLRTHTPEQIEKAIKDYVDENNGRFLKNFSTFLNNMPEAEESSYNPQREIDDEYAHYE